jgi:hypothetical protein
MDLAGRRLRFRCCVSKCRGTSQRAHQIRVGNCVCARHDNIDCLTRIIAIPGIGKDEAWSWKLHRTNWLRDTNMLARKIPDARISIFNYTADGFDKGPVSQRLENMARKLLLGLDRMRKIVSWPQQNQESLMTTSVERYQNSDHLCLSQHGRYTS